MNYPPRTTLYGLELIGTETDQVESLRSYLQRLATAHQMSLINLTSLISCPISVHRLLGCDFHGVGKGAIRFLHAAELATGQVLEEASMGRLGGLIGPQHLTAVRNPRYCPICVREPQDELPHGRLLWELSFVTACPLHRIRLLPARICGAPITEQLRVGRRPVHPGVCGHCGSIGFRCSDTIVHAAAEEIWVAGEAGKVVALPGRVVAGLGCESLRAGIEATVRSAFDGKPVRAALKSGLARACVLTWMQGKSRPALGSLFKFAYSANASVASLLQGEFKEAGKSRLVMQKDIRARRYRRHDWARIRTLLREAEQRESPPTLGSFASSVCVDRNQLREKFPAESEALVRRAAERRRFERSLVESEARGRYRDAAESLKKDGVAVTAKRLQDRSGVLLYRRDNGPRRRALIQVLAENSTAATDLTPGSHDGDSTRGSNREQGLQGNSGAGQ